jgi:hypothetical protein
MLTFDIRATKPAAAVVLWLPRFPIQHHKLSNQTPSNPISAPVVHLGWRLLAVLVIALIHGLIAAAVAVAVIMAVAALFLAGLLLAVTALAQLR